MIRPNFKKLDRFGVQGKIGFEHTNPNANAPLFRDIQKFISGDLGLGGSGGATANRVKTQNLFQQSNVFSSPGERDAVTSRLEKQFTEYLQNTFGAQAQKSGMSIPQLLQTQGIHGIHQSGTGDDVRYSAFSNDDFKYTSFNPLTGSNERALKASMKMSGAMPEISGGTNERRTLSVYLRDAELKAAQKMTSNVAKRLNIGTSNKGDLEAVYATQKQRSEIKLKHARNKNDIALNLMEDANSPAREEIRSKILKQYKQKQVYAEVESELKASGQLPDDQNQTEKERRQSPAAAAAKGMMGVITRIGNTITTIKSLLGNMIGILKSLVTLTGKLVMDSASVGIDPELARRMHQWGLKHPGFTEGNDFILMDMVKSFKAKFADLTRFGSSADFTSAAFNNYAGLIGKTLKASINKNPLQGTELITGFMAQRLMSIKDPAERRKHLMIQQNVLEQEYGTQFAAGYAALVKAGLAEGWLNEKNAANIFNESVRSDRVNKLSTGLHLDNLTGGVNGAMDVESNGARASSIMGDLSLIGNALFMKLLTNIDTIIQILYSISRAILSLMVKLNVPGADEGLKAVMAAEKEQAVAGYGAHLMGTQKYLNYASNVVTNYLYDKKLRGSNLAETRDQLLGKIMAGKELPDQHKSLLAGKRGRQLLAAIASYKIGNDNADDMYGSVHQGRFTTTGNLSNMLQAAGYAFHRLKEKYGVSGTVDMSFINAVENTAVGSKDRALIEEELSGILRAPLPSQEDAFSLTGGMGLIGNLGVTLGASAAKKAGKKKIQRPARANRVQAEEAKEKMIEGVKGLNPFGFNLPSGIYPKIFPLDSTGGSLPGAQAKEPIEIVNVVMINGKEVTRNKDSFSDDIRIRAFNSQGSINIG